MSKLRKSSEISTSGRSLFNFQIRGRKKSISLVALLTVNKYLGCSKARTVGYRKIGGRRARATRGIMRRELGC